MTGFARTIFAGGDLRPAFNALLQRAGVDPGARLDLAAILQLTGQRDQGLALQADALRLQRRFRISLGDGQGRPCWPSSPPAT
jgi:hypothetical protein